MYSIPLDPKKKQKEWKIIQTIARNNNSPQNLLQKLNRQIKHKIDHTQTEEKEKDKKIWTSPKVRKITNLFEHTHIGIAFRKATTLHQLTKPKMPMKHQTTKKVEFTNSHVIHAIDHT